MSFWLHFAINVLSTLLLGASNYTMQCLTSPTREEIDRAHSRHVWLDIGIPSVRNLRNVARYRINLWWLLAVFGVPLHLLYNSAVFSTLASQEYSAVAVVPEVIHGGAVDWSTPGLQGFNNSSSWTKLDNTACIKAYAQPFVSAYGDLLLISSSLSLNASNSAVLVVDNGNQQTLEWMCSNGPPCNINILLSSANNWIINGFPEPAGYQEFAVQYCLSEPKEEHCQMQFSVAIMGIVIVCNLMKAVCMLLALTRQRSQPLVTLGDAIETFLQRADPATAGMCLADKSGFTSRTWSLRPREWNVQQRRWFSSASMKRWLACNILYVLERKFRTSILPSHLSNPLFYVSWLSADDCLSCILTLGTAGGLLAMRLTLWHPSSTSLWYLWQMGYGAVTSEAMIKQTGLTGFSGLLFIVLVANLPQVLLSFLFLTYNGLFTCMLLGDEWNGYAHERKTLRVTNPTGLQRSTYRLQLPYKYGIPLLILSGTLHWLVSQSLFLARVASFTRDGHMDPDPTTLISTVGYSCIAIITVIILGAIVVLLGILIGFRKYRPGIPLVGSCSAAISAACHPPEGDDDAATKALMWGAVSTGSDGIGHACVTSFEVTSPVEGKLYSGFDGDDGDSTNHPI